MSTLTYTLRDDGADLVVELWAESEGKQKNHARLLVDGVEVDRAATEEIGDVRLGTEAGHPTKVSWWWAGRPWAVTRVEAGLGEERHRTVPFAPPPGTAAARRHAWAERHPRLWAARHVVAWALGALGVSALVSALVRLLSGWVSLLDWLPDLPDLPSVPWPAAPQWWTDAWTWFGDTVAHVLDLLLGWVPDGPWVKVVLGLAVAVAVAVSEVRRRERHHRASTTREDA